MTEEVKDAIRGYSCPSSLSMFNVRHKWPDIIGKSLKFPRFPTKPPILSPRVSSASSATPSSCSPRTCPPTSPPSTSRGAASVRPGWRASAPPGTGMGSMATPTHSHGSFRSPAVPGHKARMMSEERETMDNHHSSYHKWPDIMEESAREAFKKSHTIPSKLPIPSSGAFPVPKPTSPTPSSPCSPRTCPSNARTPPTSPCRTSRCSSVPGMLRLNRGWPGLCMTSPGTGRSRLSPSSFAPWSSSRG